MENEVKEGLSNVVDKKQGGKRVVDNIAITKHRLQCLSGCICISCTCDFFPFLRDYVMEKVKK